MTIDWFHHWFYIRVNGVKKNLRYPLALIMGEFKPLTKIKVDRSDKMVRCEAAFKKACGLLSGRDVVEKFIAAGISPLCRDEFRDFDLKEVPLEYVDDPVPIPTLGVIKSEKEDGGALIARIEETAEALLGPYTKKEYFSRLAILGN